MTYRFSTGTVTPTRSICSIKKIGIILCLIKFLKMGIKFENGNQMVVKESSKRKIPIYITSYYVFKRLYNCPLSFTNLKFTELIKGAMKSSEWGFFLTRKEVHHQEAVLKRR
jgi:hypothetical protein